MQVQIRNVELFGSLKSTGPVWSKCACRSEPVCTNGFHVFQISNYDESDDRMKYLYFTNRKVSRIFLMGNHVSNELNLKSKLNFFLTDIAVRIGRKRDSYITLNLLSYAVKVIL